jgi:phage repressor protein C with HTH and peptisase S24 domain
MMLTPLVLRRATLSAQNREFKAARFAGVRHRRRRLAAAVRSGCRLERTGNNSYHRLSPSGASMLTHVQVWSAIDRLAARAGLSASGLARRAGLDPTTFNKSKRVTPEGRQRWPSTESIAKALGATGTPVEVFVELINAGGSPAARAVPLLGFAQAGAGGYFDDGGFPIGGGWDQIAFPAVSDAHAYALEVSGQSMEPAYRDGDVIIVSPAAPIRRGDRVVVRTTAGEVIVKELKRRTAKAIELRSLNAELADRTLAAADMLWIARILWASQ